MNDVSNSLTGIGNPVIYVATGRLLGYTDKSDPVNSQIQTVYAIKDDLSKTGVAAYIGNPRSPNTGFNNFVRQYLYQPTTTTRIMSTNAMSWTSNSGWYVDLVATDSATNLPLVPNPSPGERVKLDPHLVSGTLSVISSVPAGSACAIGGTSWVYGFDYSSGQNIPNHDGGVLLDQGAEGSVIVDVAGTIKEIITLTGGDTVTKEPPTKGTASTRQSSWRELIP
jgi:type IV pilus assembly protein PilY1